MFTGDLGARIAGAGAAGAGIAGAGAAGALPNISNSINLINSSNFLNCFGGGDGAASADFPPPLPY